MKPGILTTEFWLVVIVNVLTQAGTLDVPLRFRWAVTLATITGYALSRGLAKQNASMGLDPIALFDTTLDDPSFAGAAGEPKEPPASSSASAWADQARAAGWTPPATPPPPSAGAV